MIALKENYKILTDWEEGKYIEPTLDWDCQEGKVYFLMPGYVEKALKQFQHEPHKQRQDAPYPWNLPDYGENMQYARKEDDPPR